MTRQEIPSAAISQLRGVCLRIMQFDFTGQRQIDDRALFQAVRGIAQELQRAVKMVAPVPSFNDVAGQILSAIGVESGLVQVTIRLDKDNVVRVPGGAGAWIHGNAYRDNFRVLISSGKSYAEREGPDLLQTAAAAFEKIGAPMPEALRLLAAERKEAVATAARQDDGGPSLHNAQDDSGGGRA